MRKSLWSPEEDAKLKRYVTQHGYGNWSDVAKHAGLQRCGKSCRLRWINYLRPDLKRGKFSPEEIRRIVNLHRTLGNSWSKIAACLPGRTDNDIKNFWHSYTRSTRLLDGGKGKVDRCSASNLAMKQPCNDLGVQAQPASLQMQFSKCSASTSDGTSLSYDSHSNNIPLDCDYDMMTGNNELTQYRVYEEPIQSETPKVISITCSPAGCNYINPASEIYGEHINMDMNSLSSFKKLSTDDFYAVAWDAAPPEGLQSVIWNFMNGGVPAQKNPDHLGAWRVQQHADIFGSMARADLIDDLFKDQSH